MTLSLVSVNEKNAATSHACLSVRGDQLNERLMLVCWHLFTRRIFSIVIFEGPKHTLIILRNYFELILFLQNGTKKITVAINQPAAATQLVASPTEKNRCCIYHALRNKRLFGIKEQVRYRTMTRGQYVHINVTVV
jgi:hypothetical protein